MSVSTDRAPARPHTTTAYWVTTGIVVAESAAGGLLDLLHQPPFFTVMQDLGYPAYFATILGVAKLAAVPVLLAPGLPRLKEWAYAGVVFTLAGAAASHLAAGDGPGNVVAPLAFAAIGIASWALRPRTRRLAD